MKETRVISEQDLREVFADDASWLGRSISDIYVLNVFPVSDGDCGITTIHSNLEEAYQASDRRNGVINTSHDLSSPGGCQG